MFRGIGNTLGMVWNVFLICLTFFLTIFGTFLTRSGLIASVHSFAQSSIGSYFAGFLLLLATASTTLVMWRWPELRDIPANPRVRWAAVIGGWIVVAACLPGLALIWRTPLSVGWRVTLIAVVAGGACSWRSRWCSGE
jgi:cytochrome c biogenesis factor